MERDDEGGGSLGQVGHLSLGGIQHGAELASIDGGSLLAEQRPYSTATTVTVATTTTGTISIAGAARSVHYRRLQQTRVCRYVGPIHNNQ